MKSPVVFVLILATIITFKTAPTLSQTIHASENPVPVGSNVTLYSQTRVTTGLWQMNGNLIVFVSPAGEIIPDVWRNRVIFNSTSSSLTVKSVQVADSGTYSLQQVNGFRADLMLSVRVPISNVTLRANATNLIEYNDTAVFMCSVSNGTSLSYEWLNGSSMITAGGRVQLSDGGATLTLVHVTRYDKGPFKCNVSNEISHEMSLPVRLNISFGPSNPQIAIAPMMYTYRTGSNITLTCSAESKPAAMMQWKVNGMHLNHYGPELKLERATENNTGNYQCILHNTATNRFASTSVIIRILDPLSKVLVNHTGRPAILHKSFTLYCEVTGTVDSIKWWMNGRLIHGDNTTTFGMGNKTLTLDPVQMSDSGDYQCQAFNYVSNMTSPPFMVEVNYGPEMATIMGPTVAKTGDNVTLSCYASSHPPSTYKWFFNGSMVANMSKYYTPPLTTDMSGKYICMAYNKITGKNSTAYTMLTVVDPITDVQVKAPMKLPIEGYSFNLTCNVTGPVDHVYWMKNGKPLHEGGRIVFSMHNKTVTFNPVDHTDTGYYQCKAINAVGNMSSPSYKLLVNFGPETPVIYGPAYAETGRTTYFNCSAKSEPPSQYSWWFNGSEVSNTSVIKTGPLSFNMSGEYKCVAYNDVTMKNSSKTKMLTVIEAIKSVMVRNYTIPINYENFTLTCEVVGPYDKIYWMKDDMHLGMNTTAAGSNMSYHMENNTLQFTPVTLHNDGTYNCVAVNKAAAHKSPPNTLLVNYGPLSMGISGPDSAEIDSSVTLMCYADSRPESDFYWFFDNKSIPLTAGPTVTFPAVKKYEGYFICMARNPVTNITMYQTKAFTVDHASALHMPSQGALMLMGLFALSANLLFN